MIADSTTAIEQRLAVLEDRSPGALLVHEIYASIQGESTYAGLPCTFVRLTGCHLRCRWCDTPYAFTEGRSMLPDQVFETIKSLAPNLVEFTGGEPLAQAEVHPLMSRLADLGKQVLLETSGSLSIESVDPRVTIILDVKCPSSGEAESNRFENLALLKPQDEVKFVIGDRVDFDWAMARLAEYGISGPNVLFAPVFGELPAALLCEWILQERLTVRFQPQLHKHVWDPQARGV